MTGPLRNLVGPHHPRAAVLFDFGERRLDVVDNDVERHVPVVARRRLADAAADAALKAGNRIDDAVLNLVVGNRGRDVPAEHALVEVAQLRRVVPHDLEMHNRVFHCRKLLV